MKYCVGEDKRTENCVDDANGTKGNQFARTSKMQGEDQNRISGRRWSL